MINARTPGHTLADLTDRLVDALTVAGTDGPTRRVLAEALREVSAGVTVTGPPPGQPWESRDRDYREVGTAFGRATEALTVVLADGWYVLTQEERHKVALALRNVSEVLHDVALRACEEEEDECERKASA